MQYARRFTCYWPLLNILERSQSSEVQSNIWKPNNKVFNFTAQSWRKLCIWNLWAPLSLSRDLLISFLLPCLYPAFFERESVLGSLMYIDGCLLPGKIVLFPACYKVQSDKCLLLWPRVWVSFSARYCYGEGWLLFFFFFF